MDLKERFRGSILGLAVGDALGHPTEFISSVSRIREKYGEKGLTDFAPSGLHKPGTFTDDTQMTISVMRALIRAGHKPLDEMMKVLGDEFVAWAEHKSNNRAPGGTCLAGCRKLRQGVEWRAAGVKESKGCGAAMRAAPVGLFFHDDDDMMVRVAAAQSTLTHAHPTGIASGVAAAAPVAWIAKGNGLDGIVEYTKSMVSKLTPEFLIELGSKPKDVEEIGIKEQLEILDETLAALSEEHEDVCQLLGGAWVGEEAVATALWCVLKANGNFEEAVLRGANSSGDSDSIACIAGSIAGALHGTAGIKASWIENVERTHDLDALATKLYECKASKSDTASIPGSLDFFDAEKPPSAQLADEVGEDSGEEETVGDDEEGVGTDWAALSVEELEKQVEKHNKLYWELAAPVISDVEFDKLTRLLQAKHPQSKALKHLGPRPDAFKAVKHAEAMLSLDKCYERDELDNWLKDVRGDVVVMAKVDGLACSLRYDASGALQVAATRGDGEEGEDITPNARGVKGIPSRIKTSAPVEIRGEVYMSLAEFERHQKEGKANPRNLAAGALRQKDPNATRAAGLSFLAYDVRGNDIDRQRDKLNLVWELGFQPVEHLVVSKENAFDAVQKLSAKRNELGYETDGIVLIADDVTEHARLGVTAHHPRWAIAWKFQGEEGTSILRGIEWSVARTGTITPVALVDPVQLSGVTVTRATLHHKGFLAKLGLTVGATLAMVRRGGVIPHVERVITAGAEPIIIPSLCPACGSNVREEGDFLICGTPDSCVKARVGRLLHFISAIDVQGIGEAIVEEAVDRGMLKSPADLYRVSVDDLASLDKCGQKNAEKIKIEIDKKRTLELDVLLRSLGVDSLGKTVARTIAEQFGSLAKIRALGVDELAKLKGIGDVTAKSIVDGLAAQKELLDDLAQLIKVNDAGAATGGALAGKSFVFTGALSVDRKVAEARVKKLGAATPSSVTKALTHLVVGGSGRDAPSTKQKAAEKLIAEGATIEILNEEQFEAFMASLSAAEPAPAVVEPADPVVVDEKAAAVTAPKKKEQLTLF